jgi:hypothetical protein
MWEQGLELTICKGLLGRILPLESELGRGTTLTIVVPLLLEFTSDKTTLRDNQVIIAKENTKCDRVLVAEDNKVNQTLN